MTMLGISKKTLDPEILGKSLVYCIEANVNFEYEKAPLLWRAVTLYGIKKSCVIKKAI